MAKQVSHCRGNGARAQCRRRRGEGVDRYPVFWNVAPSSEGSTVSRLLYQAEEIASRTEALRLPALSPGDELSQTHFQPPATGRQIQTVDLLRSHPHRGFLDRHRRDLIGK